MKAKGYLVDERLLFRRTFKRLRYLPPKPSRDSTLRGLHDEVGHWDFKTTYGTINDCFWWPTIRIDLAKFVKSCDKCQKNNPPANSLPYGKLPARGMFQTWSIDFAGPIPRASTGLRYLLFAVEHLSGWPVAQAIPDDFFNSGEVMQFVEKEIITPFVNPLFIVLHNDTKFSNAPIGNCAKKTGIKWNYVSTYNPRGSAKVERMVGTLKRALKKVVHATDVEWDICLVRILSGYRRRPGSDGMSFGIVGLFSYCVEHHR